MSLSIISKEKRTAENDIQKEIFDSIDKNENIIFSAGAGAGKTHALIESLKYIVKKIGERLKNHNQKVICITYTNVATEKIREQLGNSTLVKISTIHEREWELIKNHQKELLVIHQTKLEEEIKLLKSSLIFDEKFKKYQVLSEPLKMKFSKLMISKKDIFYKSLDEKAKGFREIFDDDLKEYPEILKSIGNFKSLVNTIYKEDNYSICVENIKENKEGYKKIKYNATYVSIL